MWSPTCGSRTQSSVASCKHLLRPGPLAEASFRFYLQYVWGPFFYSELQCKFCSMCEYVLGARDNAGAWFLNYNKLHILPSVYIWICGVGLFVLNSTKHSSLLKCTRVCNLHGAWDLPDTRKHIFWEAHFRRFRDVRLVQEYSLMLILQNCAWTLELTPELGPSTLLGYLVAFGLSLALWSFACRSGIHREVLCCGNMFASKVLTGTWSFHHWRRHVFPFVCCKKCEVLLFILE